MIGVGRHTVEEHWRTHGHREAEIVSSAVAHLSIHQGFMGREMGMGDHQEHRR